MCMEHLLGINYCARSWGYIFFFKVNRRVHAFVFPGLAQETDRSRQWGCGVGGQGEVRAQRDQGSQEASERLGARVWVTLQGKLLHVFLSLSFSFFTFLLAASTLLYPHSGSAWFALHPTSPQLFLLFFRTFPPWDAMHCPFHNKESSRVCQGVPQGEKSTFPLCYIGNHHCFSLDILTTDFIQNSW